MKSITFIVALALLAGCDLLKPQPQTAPPPVTVQRQPPSPQPLSIFGKSVVETFEAKVIAITDGDTIKVLNSGNEQIKIRIESIDCPESKQAFGAKAKQAMSDLVFGKSVTVHKTGVDFFGRTLAFVGCRWRERQRGDDSGRLGVELR